MVAHAKRKSVDAPTRRCKKINVLEGKRGSERPKKSLNEVIRQDLNILGLKEDMAQDRRL